MINRADEAKLTSLRAVVAQIREGNLIRTASWYITGQIMGIDDGNVPVR